MTDQAKHTPGPWTIDKHGIITGGAYQCTSVGAVCTWQAENRAKAGTAIMDGWTGEMLAEATANARLIAAAPDLLEAATRGLAVLENEPECAIYKAHASMLRVAIAKATK